MLQYLGEPWRIRSPLLGITALITEHPRGT